MFAETDSFSNSPNSLGSLKSSRASSRLFARRFLTIQFRFYTIYSELTAVPLKDQQSLVAVDQAKATSEAIVGRVHQVLDFLHVGPPIRFIPNVSLV